MSYRILAIMILMTGLLSATQMYAQRGRMGGRGRTGFSAFSFSYEYLSGAGLDNPGTVFDPGLELEVTSLKARLSLPPLGMRRSGRRGVQDRERGQWMIVHALGYHQRRVAYGDRNALTTASRLDRIHGIEYDFSLIHRPSRSWRVLLQVKPGIYSDLEGKVDSDHWNIQAALLLDRVLDSGFVIGLGAGWSAVFGKNLPLPLLHLESKSGSNPRVRMVLPTMAECSWRLEGGIEIGAAARMDGNRYALGGSRSADGGRRIDMLRYANLTVGPFVTFRAGRGLTLMLEGGGTVYRRFETTLADALIDNYELNNASFFRLSLRTRR